MKIETDKVHDGRIIMSSFYYFFIIFLSKNFVLFSSSFHAIAEP